MANRRSGVASTASKTVGLSGMARWSIGVGGGLMDARRLVVFSGVAAAAAAVGPGKVNARIPLKDGTVVDGSAGS